MASSSASCASTATQTESRRTYQRLPPSLIELLDIAIFSFACISGLRANGKVRGDPVLNGVCAMFGRLLSCASPQALKDFRDIAPTRLADWKPGQVPTAELLTLISSKMKAAKAKEVLTNQGPPAPPEVLVEKCERFDERADRVKAVFRPRCWRCKNPCSFCLLKGKSFLEVGFRAELVSPFTIDVLDDLNEVYSHSGDSSEERDKSRLKMRDISQEEAKNLYHQCISGEFSDEEEGVKEDEEGEEDGSL